MSSRIPKKQRPTFSSKNDLVRFIQDYHVEEKKPFRVGKSDDKRYEVHCNKLNCKFKATARRQTDGKYELVTFETHSCDQIFPSVSVAWLKRVIEEKRLVTERTTPNDIKNAIKTEFASILSPGP